MAEFIEELEAYLRLNRRGEISDRLTLDYISLEIKKEKRRQEIEHNMSRG